MTGSLKRDLAGGLAVLVPLLITFYALRWTYWFVAELPLVDRLAPQLPIVGRIDPTLSRVLFALGAFLALAFVVGHLARTAIGGIAEARIDALVNRIPGFRMAYNASKTAVETAVSGDIDLRRPAKVELWEGMRLTAFHTGKRTADGRRIMFVPTSPNVTSGFVVEVDDEDVTPTDESLEEALTRVISAGFGERDESRRRGAEQSTRPGGESAEPGGGNDATSVRSRERGDAGSPTHE